MLSERELREIRRQFELDHLRRLPPEFLGKYITCCGLSYVGAEDEDAPANEYHNPCIIVGLRQPLPEGTILPVEYQGLRVIVKAE